MKAISRGQIMMRELLTLNDFSFQEEYIFKQLKSSSGRYMPVDFAVFYDDSSTEEDNVDFCIEMQGEQHYKAVDVFGGKKGLKRQQYNDRNKEKFLNKKGIKLIKIPYHRWEEYTAEDLFTDLES